MNRWVYLFSEGSKEQKDLLGGKGANLAEMTKLGLPVPTGFTVTTEACLYYLNHGNQLIEEMKDQVMEAVETLSAKTGKNLVIWRIPCWSPSEAVLNFRCRV